MNTEVTILLSQVINKMMYLDILRRHERVDQIQSASPNRDIGILLSTSW
jgi:hypothetical protein